MNKNTTFRHQFLIDPKFQFCITKKSTSQKEYNPLIFLPCLLVNQFSTEPLRNLLLEMTETWIN
uniref:Uncharacterized protein n=1 Tax=Arundo donax TaxID=35708 RepID=A0A0A8XN55_ARUDO